MTRKKAPIWNINDVIRELLDQGCDGWEIFALGRTLWQTKDSFGKEPPSINKLGESGLAAKEIASRLISWKNSMVKGGD